MADEKKGWGEILKTIGIKTVNLDFVRAAIFKTGGRKTWIALAAIGAITNLAMMVSGNMSVGLGLACLGIGIAGGGGAIAVAWEDRGKSK